MKIYRKHIKYLQVLNLLSALIILVTVVYVWFGLLKMPDTIWIAKSFKGTELVVIPKSQIWGDIRLMVTTYLLFSLITVFIEVIPFRCSSGFHRAQTISVVNLGICLIFAVIIIRAVWSACF